MYPERMIAVPSLDRGQNLRPVVCGKKRLLNLFAPGMQPAIADKEFAKISDCFFRPEEPADHFEVPPDHIALLGNSRRSRRRPAGQDGMKALVNPWISNRAPRDEDTVESGGFETLNDGLRLEKVAASDQRRPREGAFDFGKTIPIDIAGEFLHDGTGMDDQGIDVQPGGPGNDFVELIV